MQEEYSRGIAFIFEGETEKVFYSLLLRHYCTRNPSFSLEKRLNEKSGEVFYELVGEKGRVLVMMYVVGTISQITNSGNWFAARCHAQHKGLDWSVVLCYDTDDYAAPITKFQEGDWANLRKSLSKQKAKTIIDMASNADIEDTMLLDSNNVFAFLDMSPVEIPRASKGKLKMKKLFRMKGRGTAYHEGTRATPLIEALSFDVIIEKSDLPFSDLERACFQDD